MSETERALFDKFCAPHLVFDAKNAKLSAWLVQQKGRVLVAEDMVAEINTILTEYDSFVDEARNIYEADLGVAHKEFLSSLDGLSGIRFFKRTVMHFKVTGLYDLWLKLREWKIRNLSDAHGEMLIRTLEGRGLDS